MRHSSPQIEFFSEASIKHVLIMDDFIKFHTNRHPNHQQFFNCMSMYTIVMKALKAVKKQKNISNIHYEAVNIKACTDAITAQHSMALLSSTQILWSHSLSKKILLQYP